MTFITWDETEILGYVGGFFVASSLLPQVLHTVKTRSTRDIAYGYQILYITGLIFYMSYFVTIKASAAWICMSFELSLAVSLFAMKLYLDGCSRKSKIDEGTAYTKSESVEDDLDLDQSMSELRVVDAVRLQSTPHLSTAGSSSLVQDSFKAFHILIDVVLTEELPVDVGDSLILQLRTLAAADLKVSGVVLHLPEVLDGIESGGGGGGVSTEVTLSGMNEMSAHYCNSSGRGMLALNICACEPDKARQLARDALFLLKQKLPKDSSQFYVHHLPRFPNSPA